MKRIKSERAGFLGTFFFHIFISLLLLLLSLSYTVPNKDPKGYEVIHKFKLSSSSSISKKNDNSIQNFNKIESNDNDMSNDIVEQNQESFMLPNQDDSLLLVNTENSTENTISAQLDEVLSFLDDIKQSNNFENSKDDVVPDPIIDEYTSIDDVEEGTYILKNRHALEKPIPNYMCNETGVVVVRVWVNRKGETIDAEPGVRGSTDASKCLLDEAYNAAKNTTWKKVGLDAPELQIGQITYNFYMN